MTRKEKQKIAIAKAYAHCAATILSLKEECRADGKRRKRANRYFFEKLHETYQTTKNLTSLQLPLSYMVNGALAELLTPLQVMPRKRSSWMSLRESLQYIVEILGALHAHYSDDCHIYDYYGNTPDLCGCGICDGDIETNGIY